MLRRQTDVHPTMRLRLSFHLIDVGVIVRFQIITPKGSRFYSRFGSNLQARFLAALRVNLVPNLAVLQGQDKRALAVILNGCKG
jgi:hypothetical protein